MAARKTSPEDRLDLGIAVMLLNTREYRQGALRVVFQMAAQLVDRCKSQRALRQLGLERAVDIERVAHAVDYAGLQDAGGRRLGRGALGGGGQITPRFLGL